MNDMSSKLPLINLMSFVAMVVVNFFAVQIPFFGKSPGDVSDLYANLMTPPDFSFSIWSFIYVALGASMIYEFRKWLKSRRASTEVEAMDILFVLTCVLNIGWLLIWQSLHIAVAFAIIFLLWIVLMMIYYRLAKIGDAKWQYTLPFSLYLGWVCIATLGNLNILLIDIDFSFFGLTEMQWTSGCMIIGLLGTLFVLSVNRDLIFTLTIIWAYFGIGYKNYLLETGFNQVATTTTIVVLILVLTGATIWFRKRSLIG